MHQVTFCKDQVHGEDCAKPLDDLIQPLSNIVGLRKNMFCILDNDVSNINDE